MRMVHQRGYNDAFDTYSFRIHETNMAIFNAKTTDQFAYIFQKYGEHITDYQISHSFYIIGFHKFDKNDAFWKVIYPLAKKQLATLDRNCTRSLCELIGGASELTIQDNEFWEMVEQKLVDERLYRYLTLEQLTKTLSFMSNVGRGSDELIDVVEKTLIKHRKSLTPEIIAYAREGFVRINKGSEILFKVLEDPNVQLPALE